MIAIPSILKKRSPLLHLAAIFATNIGNGVQILASGLFLYSKTGSALSFGLLIVFEYFTSFVFQLSAASVADRGHAKASAFYAELLRGLFIFAALYPLIHGQIFFIFLIGLVTNILKPFYRTANFAIGPLIVTEKEILPFNSLAALMLQTGVLVGVGCAGYLAVHFSPEWIIALNGVSYVLSAILIALAVVPGQSIRVKLDRTLLNSTSRHLFRWRFYQEEFTQMAALVRSFPKFLIPSVLCVIDFMILGFINVLLVPLTERFALGKQWISIWDGAFAVGAITGAIISMKWHSDAQKPMQLWPALLCQAALLAIGPAILLSQEWAPQGTLAWMALLGIANGYSIPVFMSKTQAMAPKQFLGRISSIRQFSIAMLSLVLLPFLSAMTDNLGHLMIGFLTMAIVAAMFSYFSFRFFDSSLVAE